MLPARNVLRTSHVLSNFSLGENDVVEAAHMGLSNRSLEKTREDPWRWGIPPCLVWSWVSLDQGFSTSKLLTFWAGDFLFGGQVSCAS